MTAPQPHVLVVYNADGTLFASLADVAHKIVSPGTYPCSLCALTHGAVAVRGEWKRFLAETPARVTVHHRDDFGRAWPAARFAFPTILLEEAGALRELVSAAELSGVESVPDLVALVERRLDQAQRV
ncbi:hypothetical protein [Tsuneonella amylolytica]|uniref:hypothetical protein n=1 Tax=Tsuneonella amylolytica TaxID=2338327 RepID=UPI000EA96570|nr:hypothetical protein [Tsuneonella amylolytica]